ncbi:MAG: hypothetical protein DRR19_03280 [Candidatus Parabeggiatoa sp. nov. 1]|nr:MAG: hypothetical protein DRR19_03280 [Gammaproteobacteria bacterium]
MSYKNLTTFNLLTLLPAITLAGSLDSPAPPGDPASGMYPLSDICNRLDTGAPGAKKSFIEVTSGPRPSGCTLNNVMEKAPTKNNSNGLQPNEAVAGQQYWGLTEGNWGPQTGTMPNQGAVTMTPTTADQPIAAGYHNGAGLFKGDSNLRPENIRAGVTIFGITGTFTGTTGSTPPPSSSSNHYSDNGNGTVTDNWSGLIWLKNANCFGPRDWETAKLLAANLISGRCGLSDGSTAGTWRLPTKEEWEAMVDTSYRNPALSNAAGTGKWTEGDAFVGVKSSWYWSSSSYAFNAGYAWSVHFNVGNVVINGKTGSYDVWPVRDGQ